MSEEKKFVTFRNGKYTSTYGIKGAVETALASLGLIDKAEVKQLTLEELIKVRDFVTVVLYFEGGDLVKEMQDLCSTEVYQAYNVMYALDGLGEPVDEYKEKLKLC